MKFTKNKIATFAIAIFLMLSMTASMMLVPTTEAHTPAMANSNVCLHLGFA